MRTSSRRVLLPLLAIAALLAAGLALASSGASILPTHTPGARYSAVTQTLFKTVCRVVGQRRSARWRATRARSSGSSSCSSSTPTRTHADKNSSHYDEDHLVSLELGGAPRSTRNLWPQPWKQARRDDNGIEASLDRKLCYGTLTLRQAQAQEIAYKHRLG